MSLEEAEAGKQLREGGNEGRGCLKDEVGKSPGTVVWRYNLSFRELNFFSQLPKRSYHSCCSYEIVPHFFVICIVE